MFFNLTPTSGANIFQNTKESASLFDPPPNEKSSRGSRGDL